MSDIVERLRKDAILSDGDEAIMLLAADEIERLRAALEKINVGEGWAALIARAALEGKQ